VTTGKDAAGNNAATRPPLRIVALQRELAWRREGFRRGARLLRGCWPWLHCACRPGCGGWAGLARLRKTTVVFLL